MNPPDLYPTCVLKVNLGCCKACVVNLNKLLWNIDGVYAVDVDPEKGQVTVSGKVEPSTLIKQIAKKKKKAELLSYEEPINPQNIDSKNTTQTVKENKNGHQKSKSKSKHKDCSCENDYDDHEFEDYIPPKMYEDIECRDPHCRLHHKKPIIHGHDYVPMIKLQHPHRPPPPPPPPPHYLPQKPQWRHHHYGEDLVEGRPRRVQYVEPVLFDRPLPQYDPCCGCSRQPLPPPPPQPQPPPPQPPPYGYYGASRYVPATNDSTQFFSDENATGCSIM